MDATSARLCACFTKIFPDLTEEQAQQAQAGRIPAWDSLATLNLLTVISEEFGVDIDLDDLEDAPSFRSLLEHLRQEGGPQVR